jgi:hypothetical protein
LGFAAPHGARQEGAILSARRAINMRDKHRREGVRLALFRTCGESLADPASVVDSKVRYALRPVALRADGHRSTSEPYGTRTVWGFPFSNILNVTTFAGAEFSETFACVGSSKSSSPLWITTGGFPCCVDVWDPSIM